MSWVGDLAGDLAGELARALGGAGWVLAHGFGVDVDLPVPLWVVQYGAAVVLVASFGILGFAWRRPRFEPPGPGRPLPSWLQRLADAPATRAGLRGLGLALTVLTLGVAAVGPNTAVANPATTWIYVWFWVGIVPLSLLFGPVWRLLNPLRTLAALLAAASGDPDEENVRPLPPRLGYWPAAAGLFAFTWLELAYGEPDLPDVLLVYMIGYGIIQLGAATRYGSAWFERGDAFEVYSTLIGRLSPFARRADGRLVARNPLANLTGVPPEPGIVATVAVILGSTGFDGISNTRWWSDVTVGWSELAVTAGSTLALAGATGLVALTFVLAVEPTANLLDAETRSGWRRGDLARAFVHSLVPIGIGYTIAHYCSLFLLQGQAGYILASDPLGRGWNLFGTIDWQISYGVANATVLGLVQVGAIVLGHLLGAVAAHDRAVAVYPPRASTWAQLALLAVMVVYTMVGIGLVVG